MQAHPFLGCKLALLELREGTGLTFAANENVLEYTKAISKRDQQSLSGEEPT